MYSPHLFHHPGNFANFIIYHLVFALLLTSFESYDTESEKKFCHVTSYTPAGSIDDDNTRAAPEKESIYLTKGLT